MNPVPLSRVRSRSVRLFSIGCGLLLAARVEGVIVSDNGFGTGAMPVAADYATETPMQIIDGLPAATTIDIAGIFKAPTASAETTGGVLGGNISGGDTVFQWTMTGSGSLSGFNRIINLPIDQNVGSVPATSTFGFETHSAPRTLLSTVQVFDTQLFRMFGQITSDTDFDLLRLVVGNDFGLPSPGKTSFTQSGANWDAGSYYDLTYRIDFVGRPGGALSGRSGSTTGTVRISVGTVVPEPGTCTLTGAVALLALARRRRG